MRSINFIQDKNNLPVPDMVGAGHVRSQLSVANISFVLLAAIQVVRTLHHAMWRDELQAFMIAASSPTVIDLFQNLKYEGHPGLWHLLLWVVTRFSANPVWMQVAHIVIALATWVVIYRYSPFTTVEKFLLIGSYFLSWEYFVISRSYALMPLLGFGYVALRMYRPQYSFLPLLLLGMLANTAVFGTIWSIALCALSFFQSRWRTPRFMIGVLVYACLLALAVLTMMRSNDEGYYHSTPHLDLAAVTDLIWYPLNAFAPTLFRSETIAELINIDGKYLILLVPLLGAPIVVCWAVSSNRVHTMEFAATYIGALIFSLLWHYPGAERHHGIVFLAFIGAVWAGRTPFTVYNLLRGYNPSWLWLILLSINTIAGLKTLSVELHRPYSNGWQVANWIERSHLSDALIIGSHDPAVSTVAGYLRRPIYYLDCECRGTYIVFNAREWLHNGDLLPRIVSAVNSSAHNDAVLILNSEANDDLNRELDHQQKAPPPELVFKFLAKFVGAVHSDEDYFVYRVRLQ